MPAHRYRNARPITLWVWTELSQANQQTLGTINVAEHSRCFSVLRTSQFSKGSTDCIIFCLCWPGTLWNLSIISSESPSHTCSQGELSSAVVTTDSKPSTQVFTGENRESHCLTCATSSKSSCRFCRALARWRDFPTPVCLLRNASPWFSIQSSTCNENKSLAIKTMACVAQGLGLSTEDTCCCQNSI